MSNFYEEKVEELYNLIKSQKIITKSNCAEFGSVIEEIAKNQLGIDKAMTQYVKLNKNTNGMCYENFVQINIDNIKFATAALANSIFHEFKHIYQNNHLAFKKLYLAKNNNLIAQYIPDNINYYLNLKDLKFTTYDLYYISEREFDAREYAFEMTDKLIKSLKKMYNNDKQHNTVTKIYLDAQLYLNQKQYKNETKKYNYCLKKVQSKIELVKKIMFFEVKRLLDSYDQSIADDSNNSNKIIINETRKTEVQEVSSLRFITSIFCDKKCEEAILLKARKEQDPFLFSVVINSPCVSVDEKLMNECFEMFSKNNYSFAEIPAYLNNWNKDTLKNIWNQKEKSLCE